MKLFLKKFGLFIFPLIIILALPFFVLLKSGELISPQSAVKYSSSNEPILYGDAYSNQDVYYKLHMLLEKKPQVLALGDSRVLQIRSAFFKDPGIFYNAGLAVEKISQYKMALDQIPKNSQPKIIIIDIEQNFFYPQTQQELADNGFNSKISTINPLDSSLNTFISSWYHVYLDLFHKKFSLSQVFKSKSPDIKTIGLNALVHGDGFRNDGSYRYGRYITNPSTPKDYNFKAGLGMAKSYLTLDNQVSEEAVNELNKFLQECSDRGIYVIGFLPPYAPNVLEELKKDSSYNYIFQLEDKLRPQFSKFGFGLYNFTDLKAIGSSDAETVDYFHATEKAYLRIFISMAEQDKNLQPLVDLPVLKDALKNSTNDVEVFKN